jgi:hypothetical protein
MATVQLNRENKELQLIRHAFLSLELSLTNAVIGSWVRF